MKFRQEVTAFIFFFFHVQNKNSNDILRSMVVNWFEERGQPFSCLDLQLTFSKSFHLLVSPRHIYLYTHFTGKNTEALANGTSLVAQIAKNLPAMQEIQVPSLGWGNPLEKGMATHSSILIWRIPWTESLVGYSLWGHKDSDTTE